MNTSDAVSHFGSVTALARALDISTSAVYQWPDIVPEGTAYKLQVLTGGALQVKPELYRRNKAASA